MLQPSLEIERAYREQKEKEKILNEIDNILNNFVGGIFDERAKQEIIFKIKDFLHQQEYFWSAKVKDYNVKVDFNMTFKDVGIKLVKNNSEDDLTDECLTEIASARIWEEIRELQRHLQRY